eukprot:SAG31_NODE_39321_length_289_cov_0.810526_1_plen_39_part_10
MIFVMVISASHFSNQRSATQAVVRFQNQIQYFWPTAGGT